MWKDWSRGISAHWSQHFRLEIEALGLIVERMIPFPLDDWFRDGLSPRAARERLTSTDIAAARWFKELSDTTARTYLDHLNALAMRLLGPRHRHPARDLLLWTQSDRVDAERSLATYAKADDLKASTRHQHMATLRRALQQIREHGGPDPAIWFNLPHRPRDTNRPASKPRVLRIAIAYADRATESIDARRAAELALIKSGLRPHEVAELRHDQLSSDHCEVFLDHRHLELESWARECVQRWMRLRGNGSGRLFPIKSRTVQKDLRIMARAAGGRLTAEGIRQLQKAPASNFNEPSDIQ